MTKKRFVKLIMSQGIQRNEANKIAESYNSRGFSYMSAYRNFLIKTSLRESFEIFGEVVHKAAENIRSLLCAFERR